MLDRDIAGGEIDQPAWNEEWRHTARAALLQEDRGLGDAVDAADAAADQRAAGPLIFVGLRMPVGIIERLPGGGHRENDEVVDLALVLRIHPLVGIERGVGAVTARDHAGDLARQIRHLEGVDAPGTAFAVQDPLPGRLHATAERRHHAEARDDNPPHHFLSDETPCDIRLARHATDWSGSGRLQRAVMPGRQLLISSWRSFRETWLRRRR